MPGSIEPRRPLSTRHIARPSCAAAIGRLQLKWRWDNSSLAREWSGQGGHWTHAADIDADGRQELLLGSSVLDESGKPLWTAVEHRPGPS